MFSLAHAARRMPRLGQVAIAVLLAAALLPMTTHSARAVPLEKCVVGAPTSVAALDAPGVRALAFNLGPDFSPAVRPFYNYAVFLVYLHNGGTAPFKYSPSDFTLEDPTHHIIYHPDLTDADIAGAQLSAGTLAPGQTVAGEIAFRVIADYDIAAAYILHWSHTYIPVPFDCI
jgi:hypothetical protein